MAFLPQICAACVLNPVCCAAICILISWECPDFYRIPGSDKWVLKGSASGDWWSLGSYTEVAGQAADAFKPLSYDVHDGSTAGLGLQKYDFGQFYASK